MIPALGIHGVTFGRPTVLNFCVRLESGREEVKSLRHRRRAFFNPPSPKPLLGAALDVIMPNVSKKSIRSSYPEYFPLVLFILSAVLTIEAQSGSVPRLIRFSSHVVVHTASTEHTVIPITFSMYATQSDGTAIWTETQQVEIDPEGKFEVLLGAASKDGLPQELFKANEERWLGIAAEGTEELPRILLVSVPYALRAGDAETLAGRPASEYVLQGAPAQELIPKTGATAHAKDGGQLSGTVSNGTPNYLAKFIDAATVATSNVIETALGLGVGVASPTQKLDVYGRIKLRARDSATSGLWLTDVNGNQQLFVGQIGLDSLSPFGIWHGNAWRLALTSAGDFGLGVGISPAARLDVSGRAMIRTSDQGTSGIWLTGANGSRSLFVGQTGITSNDAFGIWHGGAWRFIVDNTGNVGIGGTPQFPLDVRGRMLLRASTTQPSGMWFSGPSDTPQLFVGQTDTSAGSPFGILHGNDWRFILLPNGNIGAGTTAPTEKLEVAGNIKLSAGGKLIFSDGSSLGSVPGGISSLKPQDTSVQVMTSGSEVQLAVASSGVTSTKLADASVTSSKLADGSVTASKIAAGAIPPTAVAGTAATLGSNAFTGSQTVQGSLSVAGPVQLGGVTQIASEIITVHGQDDIGLDATNDSKVGNANSIRATTYSVNGSAIYATALTTAGNAVGINSRTEAPQGAGLYGEGTSGTGANFGVRGLSRSGTGTGVQGEVVGTTGTNYGVVGRAAGDNYSAGVLGEATATSTQANTYGVLARNSSKNGIGVYAMASSLTGSTYGIYGRVDSPSGIAGMFMTSASTGNVLQANNSTKRILRLDASGNFYVAGTVNQNGADYAESVAAAGARDNYEPGDVLVIDENGDRQMALSSEPYATNVAGVFSTKPGIIGSQHEMGEYPENEIPVAMVGIVPCKVSTENGPIHRGDLLVTSSTSGFAMKGTDRTRLAGAILGKAMQSLESGTGVIEVMIATQ